MNIEKNEVLENQQQENAQVKTPEMLLPQYQTKPRFELKKGDTAFAVCAVGAGIFMSIFGIFGGFAFGYLLSVCLMTALLGIYFAKGGKTCVFSVVCGLMSLAISAVFITTTNGSVRFFGVVISLLSGLVCFDGIANGNADGNRQTLGVFYSAASTIGNIGVAIKSLFTGGDGDKKTIGKAMVGLLCAIPVLVIVIPLLISSDDAFRGMMSNISGNTFTTVLKAILGVLVSAFVISYGFSLKSRRIARIKESRFAGIENVYIISFLSAIAVCYLLYLFSQLAYFFSAFSGFLPDGEITYSQYARKGFFEMCVIAVINLCLVFLSMLLAKKENGKVCIGIRATATFIAVFTLIIIATAISKMVLYINEYGMTILRLTTSAFMLFLAVVFIAVILRIYVLRINIVKTSLLTAGIIVLILGTGNVNAVCAKYNYQAYKTQKLATVDVDALYELGDEGIPYIVNLAYSKDENVALNAQRYLTQAYLYDYFDNMSDAQNFTVKDLKQNQKNKGFEHFSIPKNQAYECLYDVVEKHGNEKNFWYMIEDCRYGTDAHYDYFWYFKQ